MIKLIISILLIPFIFFVCLETGKILTPILLNFAISKFLVLGAGFYLLIQFLLFDFSRLYIFAHELMHALAGWASGGNVKNISINRNSGYVTLDKINSFVMLTPYVVPVYAILVALVYFIFSIKADISYFKPYFFGFIGFFLAFHIVHTLKTLFETKQSDLAKAGGTMFSFVMIIIFNCFFLILVMKLITPESVKIIASIKSTWIVSYAFYVDAYQFTKEFIIKVWNR